MENYDLKGYYKLLVPQEVWTWSSWEELSLLSKEIEWAEAAEAYKEMPW